MVRTSSVVGASAASAVTRPRCRPGAGAVQFVDEYRRSIGIDQNDDLAPGSSQGHVKNPALTLLVGAQSVREQPA